VRPVQEPGALSAKTGRKGRTKETMTMTMVATPIADLMREYDQCNRINQRASQEERRRFTHEQRK
jgi:hypothetical protein